MSKKLLAVILSAAVLLSMAACGQKADSSAENKTSAQEADAQVEEKETSDDAGTAGITSEEADGTAAGDAATEENAVESPEADAPTVGGWTRAESPVVTDEVKALLDKAAEKMTGAQYQPAAYLASQIVSGTNHAILCRIAPVTPESEEKYGIVYLYEDLNGNAEITEVKDFEKGTNISDLDGGWAQAESPVVTDDARKAFDKAMEGFVGVDYSPVALLSTQIVSGTNYCFLCEATVVYPGAETSYALVYIYEDLQGNAKITEIVTPAE